ncbi:MAG: Type 1 glutamine amidotransferase-like domain-containing protein [Dehalococcoidia bacterium]|nr:Type 1 glutamine amidotransferase-like domain-containing protein [Dehalococcoidia bacterium]
MAGRIALVGGDEFREGCEAMDEVILAATGKQTPVTLVIPTAAASERPERAAQNGVRHFSTLGADAHPLMVLDRKDAMDPGLVSEIDSADLVYLTGGNPAHLLDSLTESTLLARIEAALDRGAVLAGSSAGAMVMGSWMRFREWRRSLGIAEGIATLPHHERADSDSTLRELDTSAPGELDAVFGVDGRCGVLSGPIGWTALGPGNITVYRNGTWNRYADGESFTI